MLYVMLLAHLIGDYVLQFESLARWKARSLLGVLAHGAIVTLTTAAFTLLVDPAWWPYALLIGATHTAIDVVRARFLKPTHPTWELVWYLLDQLAHVTVIVLTVIGSGRPLMADLDGAASWLADPRILLFALGYMLLVNPAWVLLRFIVRGVWGARAAPRLNQGDKYGPMIERIAIATCMLLGQFHLAPLALLPRHMTLIRVHGRGVGLMLQPPAHWAESVLSVALAVAVGLSLRLVASL